MSWKLGLAGFEQTINKPTRFSIDILEISKSARVASAKKVKEVIAKKKLFYLGYNALPPEQVEILIEEYDRNSVLNFIYPEVDGDNTVKVWFERFPRERLLTPTHLWGNFTIMLEEQ